MSKINKYNKKFMHKINGKNIYDVGNLLDWQEKDLEKRVEIVNQICEEYLEPWMIEFTTEYYNPHLGSSGEISTGKPLSDEDNVFCVVQKFADYLLFCPGNKAEDVRHDRSVGREKQRVTSENMLGSAPKFSYADEKNVIDDRIKMDRMYVDENGLLVEKESKNYKKKIEQKVLAEDYKEIPELQPYKDLVEQVNSFFKMDRSKIKEKYGDGSNFVYRLVSNPRNRIRILGLIKQDQIWIKDYVKRTIYFKNPMEEYGEYDEKFIDLSNSDHVKHLLKVKDKGLFAWYGYSKRSLNNLIADMNFDDVDMLIINSLEQYGESHLSEIASIISMEIQTFYSRVATIVSRINGAYVAKKYDWYYLNYAKGEYKKCGKCKEYRLIKFFGKNSYTMDGYANTCKFCRNRFVR